MTDFSAQGRSVEDPPRQLVHPSAMRLALFATMTFLVALLGPFGTYEQGLFFERLIYWTVANVVSYGMALALIRLMRRSAPNMPILWREVILCIALSAVFAPVLLWWTLHMFPHAEAELLSVAKLAGYIFAVCVCVSILRHGVPIWMAQSMRALQDMPAPEPEPLPRLLERFEEADRSPVQRLSVDGHKVQVVMSSGLHELRMRLSDAIQEMKGVDGFPVHRSHWVAASAIDQIAMSKKGRPEIILHNGDRVPVGRKYEFHLEERGLL